MMQYLREKRQQKQEEKKQELQPQPPSQIEEEEPKPLIRRGGGGRRMKPRPPTNEVGIRVIKYSERSYALLGDTISHKTAISGMGCKFNPNLKDPQSGNIVPGWVCSAVKRGTIIDTLEKAGAQYTLVDEE